MDDLIVDLRNLESTAAPSTKRRPATRFLLPIVIVLLFLLVVILVIRPFDTSTTASAPNNPLAEATFTKLVDFDGQDAAISPDGKFIAFVSDREGIFDVWIVQAGTGEVYNRTQGTAGDVRNLLQSVGFTADGTDVWIGGTPERRMRAIPLLTGPARNVLRDSVIFADWSPEGTRVVYHTHSAGDPIFVADADGSNSRAILVANPGGHQHYPAWSPDAQWIYFARGLDDNWTMDLWRVRPDGGGPEQLTDGLRDVRYPTPLDDRTVLVVARDENGAGPWLWSVDVDRKTTSRASIGVEQYSSLSSSANGRTLVATVVHPQASLWSVPILDGVATETDARRYDVQAVRAHAPRFGGTALYFLSSRGTAEGLWKRESGELTEVWNGVESTVFEPVAVNPQGTSLAMMMRREGTTRLYLMNSDGSNVRHLTDDVEVHGTAAWSPDGAWIVTGGNNADGHGLFKISVSDGRVRRIVDDYAVNPIWSPAEDLIIYAGKQINAVSTLYGVRPDGNPVKLPKLTVYAPAPRFRFTPDGRGLVYMKGLRMSQDFFLLDLSTMKSRQLTELAMDAEMRTFDISPHGRTIVFDRFNDNSEVVLIELSDHPAVR
jgi:Tol biopolymer transport system component